MKINHILFAISIAVLTSCGTSEKKNNSPENSHVVETHAHSHSEHKSHNHAGHSHQHHEHSHDHHNHAHHNHEHHNHAHVHNHNHHAHQNNDVHNENNDEIIFSDVKAERFGVKTIKIKKTNFNDIIKVSGQILPSQSDESVISAKSSGIIRLNSNAIIGKQLATGTSIGSISSQNIAGGDANEAAKINFEAAKRELDRITPLYNDKIITEREYNQAKQVYDQAKAAISNNADAGSAATSNISGTITQIYVKDGEFVEIGTPIAVVSKNSRLILCADLPNRYVSYLTNIKTANFKPSYTEQVFELSKLNGKIVSNKNLSVVTPGYIPVNFEFTNSVGIIPGAFADIYLIGATKKNCIVLPIGALTEEEGNYFVYEKIHNEAYLKKAVTIGLNNGEDVEILSGVNEGNEIVTEGAIMIKLASQANAVPGHSHEH